MTIETEKRKRQVILLVGTPRSGTTWLANILNTQPHVVYSHEPFVQVRDQEVDQFVRCVKRGQRISEQQKEKFLVHLVQANTSTCRPPFFKKDFVKSSPQLLWCWWSLARMTHLGVGVFRRVATPNAEADFSLVIKNGMHQWAAPLANALDADVLFLIRHPCSTIASRLRGQRLGLMPQPDRRAVIRNNDQLIQAVGFDESSFLALDDIELQTVLWLAENLEYGRLLQSRPTSQVVVYESLRDDPFGVTRMIFNRLKWPWTSQTTLFLEQSTGRKRSWLPKLTQVKRDYFGVYRHWAAHRKDHRHALSEADYERVMALVEQFPDVNYWSDTHQPTPLVNHQPR